MRERERRYVKREREKERERYEERKFGSEHMFIESMHIPNISIVLIYILWHVEAYSAYTEGEIYNKHTEGQRRGRERLYEVERGKRFFGEWMR